MALLQNFSVRGNVVNCVVKFCKFSSYFIRTGKAVNGPLVFLYFCLFVLPYEIREEIFEGTPPVLKNQAPPAEKKIGPPPLGFWSLCTYDHTGNLSITYHTSNDLINYIAIPNYSLLVITLDRSTCLSFHTC